MINDRYKKNIGLYFTPKNQEMFLNKTFAILGCGGQGGYIATYLARLGVKKLILFDGDIFDISNLNRQVGATENTLGQNKALIIGHLCKSINNNIEIHIFTRYFGISNDYKYLQDCDFIFDEMDNTHNLIAARQELKQALLHNIPISCSGNLNEGSILTLIKNNVIIYDRITENLINNSSNNIAQPAYLCAITAGLEVNEMIKFFLNQKNNITLIYDFYNNEVRYE